MYVLKGFVLNGMVHIEVFESESTQFATWMDHPQSSHLEAAPENIWLNVYIAGFAYFR